MTMNNQLQAQYSAAARQAVARRQWATVDTCAKELLELDADSAEGWFLTGLTRKAQLRTEDAIAAFRKALELDNARYDAAVELAVILVSERLHGEAAGLVSAREQQMWNSPLYLNKAGTVFKHIGLNEKAHVLYKRANELQPGVELIMANLADTSMFIGEIDEARALFRSLLERNPSHQRNHLSLARLARAENQDHIEEMLTELGRTNLPPDRNIFMYYALGKEYEDLEEWDKAFEYYEKAGDAVASVADYDIESDLELLDTIMETCTADWLSTGEPQNAADRYGKVPIFIVGLPRTGTTLTDRIIGSHSDVRSLGETQYMQMVLRHLSEVQSAEKMTPEMIRVGAGLEISTIGDGYMDMLSYRLGDEPFFVDKLPFNLLYLGFIAKAFPDARIVLMNRNPMDSCFSMYKQVFTWAYKFSYTQEGLGRFYAKYTELVQHWRSILGDRLVEARYEQLVSDQEGETRALLDRLGLDFEAACLKFEKNKTATATASSVQVREKAHTRSVERWRRYEKQLQPLRERLEQAGIEVG